MENVMNETQLYICGECDFASSDQEIVVNHLQVHETPRQGSSNIQDEEFTEIVQEGSGSVSWSEEQTKLLINQYKEVESLFEQGKVKTLKRMWEKIREVMLQHNCNYSIQELENKWKSLVRSYETVVDNNRITGRGRISCPYERELGEILDKRHSINPVCILDSGSNDSPRSTRVSTPNITRTPRQNLQMTDDVLKELQQLLQVQAEALKWRGEKEERKFKQRQDILEELKFKNRLLQNLLQNNTN